MRHTIGAWWCRSGPPGRHGRGRPTPSGLPSLNGRDHAPGGCEDRSKQLRVHSTRVGSLRWLKTLKRSATPTPLPQLSGVRFSFDPRKPAGSRIAAESVTVSGQPLALDKEYKLCTKEYLANVWSGVRASGCVWTWRALGRCWAARGGWRRFGRGYERV
eukprot:356492-Chlamydomonas_euryale.AAC.2